MDYMTSTLSTEYSVSDQEVISAAATSEIESDLNLKFSWADYVVFTLMLLFSACIGIYYGFFANKKAVENEPDGISSPSIIYILKGGSGLTPFPVAMSLVASYISGVTMIGTPSEIYYYGLQYWMVNVGIVFMALALAYIYLPIFLHLKISSSYEYLERRFSRHVRAAACAMFVIDEMLFLPVVLYVPSMVFAQVTGFNLYGIGAITCAVCIFYTTVGGLKAVVWADTLQIIVMFASLFVIVIVGLVKIGGFGVVWTRASEGDRLVFNFDPNPLVRTTVWTMTIGGFFYWTSFNAVNQMMVQRYLALPSLKDARISVVYFTIGVLLFVTFCCGAGLLIYSKYYNCDPKKAKLIETKDQLLPLFVMSTAHNIYGLPGLFIAGVFSAALSSLSTVLNSTTIVIMNDILESYFHIKFESSWALTMMAQGLCIGLGLIAIGGTYVVSKLGGILQVTYLVSGVAAGSTFGVFTLGVFCPYANEKGALIGGLSAVILMFWICIGSKLPWVKEVTEVTLPVSLDACPSAINVTAVTDAPPRLRADEIFPLYRLSYLYMALVGVIIVLSVGSLVSLCTGKTDVSKLDVELFAEPVRGWMIRRREAEAGKEEQNEADANALELTSPDEGLEQSNEPKNPEDDELI